MSREAVIEREVERAFLDSALDASRDGQGSLVLLGGDAGVGKTSLVEALVSSAGVRLLRGTPGPGALAYGPVTATLREFLRVSPGGLDACGPLLAHLALLLPELGQPTAETDRATLFEAIRCGL